MIRSLLFFILINAAITGSAQNFSSFIDSLGSKKYLLEVKQLDQFFKRFNNEENILTGNENTASEIAAKRKNLTSFQTERKKVLLSLFNLQDSSFCNKSVVDFINFTCDDTNHVSLSYYDTNWYATVNCSMIYKGKTKTIILTLKNDGNLKKGFKWVIAGVNADFLSIVPSSTDSNKFISPMNHEIGFMDLFNVFHDSRNILDYSIKIFPSDKLSIFLYLVYNGEIKYIQANSIRYHFLQIKNWMFTVECFNRSDVNSGWLISSLSKATDNDKVIYKKSILSLK